MRPLKLLRWVLPLCYALSMTPLNGAPVEQSEPVQAQLVSEQQSVQPGQPFWVGVELKMAQGWDTYWVNPGDSGFPTKVDWVLPEGYTAGPLHWPYPEKFSNDALVGFGYTHSVLLMSEITPSKDAVVGKDVKIAADVTWLACNQSCIPGDAHLTLDLPVKEGPPVINQQAVAQFEAARQAVPKELSKEEGSIVASAKGGELVFNFVPKSETFGSIDQMTFIPEQGQVVDYAAPQQMKKSGEGIVLNVKRAGEDAISKVRGVLLVQEGNATHAISVNVPVKAAAIVHKVEGVSSFAFAIMLAFFGGIILNVMPCVLPVIALKIFSFVKMAGEKRSVVFQHGVLFSVGVLVSFWILSGLLLILRAYGQGIGWGFQLQEPVFVVILALILFMLGLSLFGVFEMGTSLISLGSKTSSAKSPLMGSFMSGVLATLVATPCTGPLLGPALGYAMTLPAIKSLAIFSMMGIGMAFPYLLFSAFPKLVRFLPKPGNWMIVFKQLMGFLMMATVVWLVWVFGAQTDNMATFVLLGGLLIVAIGAWVYGRWVTPMRRKMTRVIATVISAAILFVGGGAAVMNAKNFRDVGYEEGVAINTVSDRGWERYSPERVAQLQAQGVPVFVDFTAKWCLICQANKVVLHSAEVEKAFKEKGVVTMVADWTKKNPVITEELQNLGRSGVPVYALYPGEADQMPHIMPQTLKTKIVLEYLDKLPAKGQIVDVL